MELAKQYPIRQRAKRKIPTGGHFREHRAFYILQYLAQNGGWLTTREINNWLRRSREDGGADYYLGRMDVMGFVEVRWQNSRHSKLGRKQFKITDAGRGEVAYYEDDFRRVCVCCEKKFHQGNTHEYYCANCLYHGCKVAEPKCGRDPKPGDTQPKPPARTRLKPAIGGMKLERQEQP